MQKDKVPELAPGVAKRSKKAASALSKVRPHRSWTRFALQTGLVWRPWRPSPAWSLHSRTRCTEVPRQKQLTMCCVTSQEVMVS